MKVSVIIPTFNRAHTLGRAIQSVLSQTERDFEIIVIDDHSTDNTKSLIKQFGGIKYVLNRKSQGPAGSRNQGLEEASGKYVAFLDSDDAWFPRHLEESLSCMESLHLDACYALWYRKRGVLWERYPKEWLDILKSDLKLKQIGPAIPLGNLIAEYTVAKPFWCFHIDTLVVKKQALLNCGPFDESFFCAEDLEISFRLLSKLSVGLINKYHARYFEGDDNIVALRNEDPGKKKQFNRYMVKAFKKIRTMVEESPSIIDKAHCREQLAKKIKNYALLR